MPKTSTETACQYLDRLRNQRGETASRDAINNFKTRTGKKGLLTIADQIIRSRRDFRHRATPGIFRAYCVATAEGSARSHHAAISATEQRTGTDRQARVRASIRAGFASANPTAPKQESSNQELTGKARLQAGIRAQLVRQGHTRSLSAQN